MEQYRLIDSEFTETTGNKFSFLSKPLKQNVILKFYTLQYNCPHNKETQTDSDRKL